MTDATPGTHGFDADRLARVDAFLKSHYIDTGHLPNAQLLVARDGEVVHFSSQGSAREGGPAIDEGSLFRIASMTKPITSVAFMMPEHMAKTDPFKQVTETIGSGPLKFVKSEFVPGSSVTYERNPDYVPRQEAAEWTSGGKVVHFDRVEWKVIPDSATASAALSTLGTRIAVHALIRPITMLATVFPSEATMPMASTNSGKAMIVSARRPTTWSVHPPK